MRRSTDEIDATGGDTPARDRWMRVERGGGWEGGGRVAWTWSLEGLADGEDRAGLKILRQKLEVLGIKGQRAANEGGKAR